MLCIQANLHKLANQKTSVELLPNAHNSTRLVFSAEFFTYFTATRTLKTSSLADTCSPSHSCRLMVPTHKDRLTGSVPEQYCQAIHTDYDHSHINFCLWVRMLEKTLSRNFVSILPVHTRTCPLHSFSDTTIPAPLLGYCNNNNSEICIQVSIH